MTEDLNLKNTVTIGLTIIKRDDGKIRVQSSIPGFYLYGPTDDVFSDLGKAMQFLLEQNEGMEWLRRSAPIQDAAPVDRKALSDAIDDWNQHADDWQEGLEDIVRRFYPNGVNATSG